MISDADTYVHIRIVLGILQGLSMAILLNGLVRFVQQPAIYRVYLPHLLWALAMLLSLLHFWWEEMLLGALQWTLPLYLFATLYSINFYLMCAVLFPPNLDGYDDYQDYFMSRRRWLFGHAILGQCLILADIALKGPYYTVLNDPIDNVVLACVFIPIYGYLSWSRSARSHLVAAGISLALIVLTFLSEF